MSRANQIRDSVSIRSSGIWREERGDLPDINVWLALAQRDHVHHAAAQEYWQETMQRLMQDEASDTTQQSAKKLYFCRTTMLGLVRVLCQSERAKGRHVEMHQGMAAFQRFMDLDEVTFLQEPWLAVNAALTTLLNVHPKHPLHLSTDVYLAALAQTIGLRLVSFDQDYRRFEDLDCLILGAAPSGL